MVVHASHRNGRKEAEGEVVLMAAPKGGIKLRTKEVQEKLGKMPKGFMKRFEKTLDKEVDKSDQNLKKALNEKWAPLKSKGRAGQPPLKRLGRLKKATGGQIRVLKTKIVAEVGVIDANPYVQRYANVVEFGAPGQTDTGETIKTVEPRSAEWLTVFTDSVRKRGFPIFKNPKQPNAPLSARKLKSKGFTSWYLERIDEEKKYLWGYQAGKKKQSTLIAVFLKKVPQIEARPFVGPERERLLKRMSIGSLRRQVVEEL